MNYSEAKIFLNEKIKEFELIFKNQNFDSELNKEFILAFDQLKLSAYNYVQELVQFENLYYEWFSHYYSIPHKEILSLTLKRGVVFSDSIFYDPGEIADIDVIIYSIYHRNPELIDWIQNDDSLIELIYFYNLKKESLDTIQINLTTIYNKEQNRISNVWNNDKESICWKYLKTIKHLSFLTIKYFIDGEIFNSSFIQLCQFWKKQKKTLITLSSNSFWSPKNSDLKNSNLAKKLVSDTQNLNLLFDILTFLTKLYTTITKLGNKLI